MTMPPSPTDAQNAALDEYNRAIDGLNNAQAALAAKGQRPADSAQGHDQGGKEWDKDYAALQETVKATQAQAAAAAKQYADFLDKQATAAAADASPGGQARAARANAQADYYRARADGLAAKDAAAQKAANDRAQAALTRASAAADRVDSQNRASDAAANASNAAADRSRAETANLRTPEQAAQLALNNSLAEISARAKADAASAIAQKQALIDSGIEMKESDKLQLQNHLAGILAQANSERQQANEQFNHDLNQPNAQAGIDIQKQNANTNAAQVENSRVYQQQQAQATENTRQTGVLSEQAKGTSDFINQGIKLGVAPTMGLVRGAVDPLLMALHLSRQAIAQGQVPASAMPVPSAPQPAGPAPAPSAPLPAAAATPLRPEELTYGST